MRDELRADEPIPQQKAKAMKRKTYYPKHSEEGRRGKVEIAEREKRLSKLSEGKSGDGEDDKDIVKEDELQLIGKDPMRFPGKMFYSL